jgi:branched-chain amino acid transport system permease protein
MIRVPALNTQALSALGDDLVRPTLTAGLGAGLIGVYVAMLGLLTMADARILIDGTLSLAGAFLLLLPTVAAYRAGRRVQSRFGMLLAGLCAGSLVSLVMALLLLLLHSVNLRSIFIAMSPELGNVIGFHRPFPEACVGWFLGGALLGSAGGAIHLVPPPARRAVVVALAAVFVVGALHELVLVALRRYPVLQPMQSLLFSWDGLTRVGALVIGALAAAATSLLAWRADRWRLARIEDRAGIRPEVSFIVLVIALALLPALVGPYLGQVLLLVALYALMGMGLNIEVGLAGLLDLGFVAFFAVGAYTVALLTADSPLALSHYTDLPPLAFWQALPIAVIISVLCGVVFGLPVLGVRGDYLALATLGLGEIVRVLVLSDLAAPFLGGAQGVLHIPKPRLAGHALSDPVSLFYVTLSFTCIAAYVAHRLQGSRLGRAWIALKDDEDVAQALGINLVHSKLLAYGLGAAFAGLAGGIFATMLTAVYPNSFSLQVSINVLALIIIGGAGSIQGCIVGALLLIGLPELFREFGEYRFLIYGIAIVVVMVKRPAGLWAARGPGPGGYLGGGANR